MLCVSLDKMLNFYFNLPIYFLILYLVVNVYSAGSCGVVVVQTSSDKDNRCVQF